MSAGPRPTRRERLYWAIVRGVAVGFCRLVWRPKVLHRERLPTTGAYVLAPSHRSILDAPFLATVTRRRIRYMAKAELWKYRWSSRFCFANGGIPVDRGVPDRAALRSAIEAVGDGEPLAVFPEGTRRTGPRIEDLFDGVAYVAARGRVPIVPVGIGGSEEILAKGRKIPKLRRVVVVVGEPIYPPELSERGRSVRRGDVAELTGRLRERLQALFDEAEAVARAGR